MNCCYQCVEVNGIKTDVHEVNYALWGLLYSLCGRTLTGAQVVADIWKLRYVSHAITGTKCDPAWQLTHNLFQWIKVGYMYPDEQEKAISDHSPKTSDSRFDDCDLCDGDNPINRLPRKPFNFNLFRGLGEYQNGIG